MTLAKAIGVYALVFVGFLLFILFMFSKSRNSVAGGGELLTLAIGYLIPGVFLNRIVLKRVIEWHPMYDTIQNVSSTKLGLVLTWPWSYPILFYKIAIVKFL